MSTSTEPATLLEIAQLSAKYSRVIDDDRLEAWPAFFTDQCLYVVTSAANFARGLPGGLVYADSAAMLRDRVKSLRKANVYERQSYRHIVGMPIIESVSDGATRTESSFLVMRIMHDGISDVFASGRYFDVVTRTGDGELKLRERVVVLDSSRIDTMLAIPL